MICAVQFSSADKCAAEFGFPTSQLLVELATEALLLGRYLTGLTITSMTGLFTPMLATVEHVSTDLLTAELCPLSDLARNKLRLFLAMALN